MREIRVFVERLPVESRFLTKNTYRFRCRSSMRSYSYKSLLVVVTVSQGETSARIVDTEEMVWISWCIVLTLSLTTRAIRCPEESNCTICQNIFKDFVINLPVNRRANDSYPDVDVSSGVRKCAFVSELWFECNTMYDPGEIDYEDMSNYQLYGNLSSETTTENSNAFRCVQLEHLVLRESGLTWLPEDFLDGLDDLNSLDLSNNVFKNLSDKFFSVSNLREVDLSSNVIESFGSTAFDKLQWLYQLNIGNNRLVAILPHTFDNLVSLHILKLNENYLRTLPPDIFASLTNLTYIDLAQNYFTILAYLSSDASVILTNLMCIVSPNNLTGYSLAADLFRHNVNLEQIDLFGNKINMKTLPCGFFSNLTRLESVRLNDNGFTSLPSDLFQDAVNLKTVNLENNNLSTLPLVLFRENTKLYALNLSFNDIVYLPEYLLQNQQDLIKLDLSNNHLSAVSDTIFGSLGSLEVLNMEHNELTTIDEFALLGLSRVRVVNFSYNSLDMTISPFVHLPVLEELYLMHNDITEINGDWITSQTLRVLNLANNRLRSLAGKDLQFQSNSLTIDVTYNNISRVDVSTVELRAEQDRYERPVIVKMDNNPIRCDCQFYDFLRHLEGQFSKSPRDQFYWAVGKLKCQSSHDFQDIAVIELESRTFQCNASSSGFPQTHCPDKCQCYLRPANKAFLINCAHKGLTEAPSKLECPPDYHIEIDLSGNLLTNMPNFDNAEYDNVTILSLNHNRISSLSVYKFPRNLEILHLNNNNLTRVNNDVIVLLKDASSLKTLTLQLNPWSCDCEALEFLKFIQSSSIKFPDLLKVNCFNEDNPIVEMSPENLCPKNIEWLIGCCVVVAFLGISVSTLAALYYRYQREIKVWLYARQWCLWLVTEDELDKDKLYDAFISYSHKDEDFVLNNLVRKLEEDPKPFKICIHFRDWRAGEWIAKQIARSVEESRRTIVVLSPNFLESVWGKMEFRAAHSQALSDGRARVIVVLYGDIGPTDHLDSELKTYLSMNTYVKWGDPWFWEKLKYSLPHRPDVSRRTPTRKISEMT